MTERTAPIERRYDPATGRLLPPPDGTVSWEDYLRDYAEYRYEWLDGRLEALTGATARHGKIISYLERLLGNYMEWRPIGIVHAQNFVMRLRLPNRKTSGREPDLIIVLNANLPNFHETFMDGPADIVIEVMSPESIERDVVEKFNEYEAGGVPEYWRFDPLNDEAFFYVRGADGRFVRAEPDADGNYTTPLLPGFKLHVPTLWREPLPGYSAVAAAVRAMLGE